MVLTPKKEEHIKFDILLTLCICCIKHIEHIIISYTSISSSFPLSDTIQNYTTYKPHRPCAKSTTVQTVQIYCI